MMTIYQQDLWGRRQPPDLQQAAIDILERFPDARNDYDIAFWLILWEHYGLAEQIPPELHEQFENWTRRQAPSTKSTWNRIQDAQKIWRPDLDASPEVRAQRNRQATQGRVR